MLSVSDQGEPAMNAFYERDQCFIADEMLEHLPLASRVGKTLVGGIDAHYQAIRVAMKGVFHELGLAA